MQNYDSSYFSKKMQEVDRAKTQIMRPSYKMMDIRQKESAGDIMSDIQIVVTDRKESNFKISRPSLSHRMMKKEVVQEEK